MNRDQFRKLLDELPVFEEPEADYVVGWCRECNDEVWIDTGQRPHGMAESCEEHQPLSDLQ